MTLRGTIEALRDASKYLAIERMLQDSLKATTSSRTQDATAHATVQKCTTALNKSVRVYCTPRLCSFAYDVFNHPEWHVWVTGPDEKKHFKGLCVALINESTRYASMPQSLSASSSV